MILAQAFDAFLLDLDGVVWRGDSVISRASETIAQLRHDGRRVVFVTNNSSRSARDYAIKLFKMKIPTESHDIVTSGHAVIDELRRMGLVPQDRIHVCGGTGLMALLKHERFEPVTDARDVRALVVGWNPRATFDDVRLAANLARDSVPFIASNDDPTYPGAGETLPGAGAIVAAVEVASGVRAKVVGKPKPELFRIALRRAGVAPGRALFCGDRPSTDVLGAHNAGIKAALVLTGVTTEAQLAKLDVIPDEIIDDLSDLLADLPEAGSLVERSPDQTLMSRVMPGNCDERSLWLALRRDLVVAVSGKKRVKAHPSLRPLLARLGIEAEDQPKLF